MILIRENISSEIWNSFLDATYSDEEIKLVKIYD